jgi:hypothetical protein
VGEWQVDEPAKAKSDNTQKQEKGLIENYPAQQI